MKTFVRTKRFTRICSAGLLPVLALIAGDVRGQERTVRLPGDRLPAVVTTGVFYQRYLVDDDRHIEEISFPVFASVPVGPTTGLSLRASPATVTGQNLEPLSGLSDAQLSLSQSGRLWGSGLVLSLGLNLPSGKRALTQEELETSVQLSRNFYDFRTPAFGQGFNLSPSVTWAVPLGEQLVVGLGVAYQYKGSFKPVEEMDESYQPGDELLLTGGVDVSIARATALSGDLTYTLYGTDTIGSEDVFEAGDRLVATLQFRKYQSFNELRVVGQFRSRGKGSLPAPGADSSPARQTLNNQLDLFGSYRMETTASTSIGLHAGVHYFDETDVFSSKLLLSAGVTPEISLSDEVGFWTSFSFRIGDFTGLEAGTGLSFTL